MPFTNENIEHRCILNFKNFYIQVCVKVKTDMNIFLSNVYFGNIYIFVQQAFKKYSRIKMSL